MRHALVLCAAMLALAGCAAPTADLEGPVDPLGDFQLGFSEVVAPNLEAMLVTETVDAETWTAAVDRALETRFGRFGGSRCYHLGVSVEAYSMPPPLVPGRLALAARVTVWDDAAQRKLNEETKLITVIRALDGSISRAARTRADKVRLLAEGLARQTEEWLREMQETEGWFGAAGEGESAAVECVRR
ncbi:hypothetical protein [Citreimonas salinaria]|uniref:Lipoprotein n=1 Tax=Citreimonas salinaria TaxID=321339 RepID=A0A1H3KFS1_9RHOB|nr:hypothetical protein [Citreimonas salinaria]SDY50468.1 hypothetical protein SAMN05444340_10986 [Citreimonas salinaria]